MNAPWWINAALLWAAGALVVPVAIAVDVVVTRWRRLRRPWIRYQPEQPAPTWVDDGVCHCPRCTKGAVATKTVWVSGSTSHGDDCECDDCQDEIWQRIVDTVNAAVDEIECEALWQLPATSRGGEQP